jgi:hypothetical protein
MRFPSTTVLSLILSTFFCSSTGVLADFHIDITGLELADGVTGTNITNPYEGVAVACASDNWNCGCLMDYSGTGTVLGSPLDETFLVQLGFCSMSEPISFVWQSENSSFVFSTYVDGGDGNGTYLGSCYNNTASLDCPTPMPSGPATTIILEDWVCISSSVC